MLSPTLIHNSPNQILTYRLRDVNTAARRPALFAALVEFAILLLLYQSTGAEARHYKHDIMTWVNGGRGLCVTVHVATTAHVCITMTGLSLYYCNSDSAVTVPATATIAIATTFHCNLDHDGHHILDFKYNGYYVCNPVLWLSHTTYLTATFMAYYLLCTASPL